MRASSNRTCWPGCSGTRRRTSTPSTDEFLDGYYGRAGRPHPPLHRRPPRRARRAPGRGSTSTSRRRSTPRTISRPPIRTCTTSLFDKAEAAVGRRSRRARPGPDGPPAPDVRRARDRQERHVRPARLLRGEGRPLRGPARPRSGCSRSSRRAAKPGASGRSTKRGLSPAAYCDSVRRFIDVQVEGNLAFRKPVAADPPAAAKYARGALSVLTDGVRGAADFKVHWLGWEGVDFVLTLDLGKPVTAREIALSTLSDFRSWILHPDERRLLGLRRRPRVPRGRSPRRSPATTATRTSSAPSRGRRTWPLRAHSPASASSASASRGPSACPTGTLRPEDSSWVFVDEIVVR
ncbi:MAG: hypothetical protein MZV63_14265 [Marinilabiliales bacterium]|nr:hypothetical protein [Marinilabiliales bacterium]